MIKITSTRVSDGGRCDPVVQNQPVPVALIHLMQFELGFGGNVIDIGPGKVVTRVVMFGFDDTTYFTGSAEEMRVLVLAAAGFVQITDMVRKTPDIHGKMVAGVLEATGGLPFLVVNAGMMLMNYRPARLATLIAAGLTDEAEMRAAMALKEDDFYTAVQLKLENAGANFGELLALAA